MKNWFLRAFPIPAPLQKRFYRQSLILVLLAICLPTILVGSGVKWIGTSRMEQAALSSRQHQIAEFAAHLDASLTNLEKTATQWAFDPELGYALKNLENEYDYEFIQNLYTTLLLIKESNPLIDRIHIYLEGTGSLYSDRNGTIAVPEEDRAPYRALLDKPQTTFWLTSFRPKAAREVDGELTLAYQLPANSYAKPLGVLLVYLNNSGVSQLLRGSVLNERGVAFLLNEEGERIGSSSEAANDIQLEEELTGQFKNQPSARDDAVFEINGRSYLVTHTTFNRFGRDWRYVSADPLADIHAPVIAASNLVYLFGAAGLLLAIVTGFIVSRRLYRPMRTLTDLFKTNHRTEHEASDEVAFIAEQWHNATFRSLMLEDRLQKQLPVMREGFLLQLLQGHFQYSRPAELAERLRHFGLHADASPYTVIGIQLSSMSQSGSWQKERDQELISFAAVNIAGEVLQESGLQADIVNLHDLTISLIVKHPEDKRKADQRRELGTSMEKLADTLHRYLRLQVTLCIGGPIVDATAIPREWDEVKRLLRFRDIREAKQIIRAEDFIMPLDEGIRYPFGTEAEIMDAVRSLDEQEAAGALDRFCEELQSNTTKEYLFRQGIMQLLGNLRFGMLKAGYNPFEQEMYVLDEAIDSGADIADIVELLMDKAIRPYMNRLRKDAEDQDSIVKRAVERVAEQLRERYADADLSLDLLAEEQEMTPLALSKAFKKATGINFIACLTEIRLRKAKEMLAETDDRINDIAEKVGYQPTYFNRIFKKNEGITPSQYRELAWQLDQR